MVEKEKAPEEIPAWERGLAEQGEEGEGEEDDVKLEQEEQGDARGQDGAEEGKERLGCAVEVEEVFDAKELTEEAFGITKAQDGGESHA